MCWSCAQWTALTTRAWRKWFFDKPNHVRNDSMKARAAHAGSTVRMVKHASHQMHPSFLLTYLEVFHRIEGWFSYDAALMFMAYNQLVAGHGVAGDVLEIGVHHGLSTIGVAALRGPGKLLYAVDLFDELQGQNVSGSGQGNRALFEQNMRGF